MDLSIPETLDRQLEAIAEDRHVTKSALLLQGAELVVALNVRAKEIDAGMAFVRQHDGELLKRLADA